jgi:hypothetical protein
MKHQRHIHDVRKIVDLEKHLTDGKSLEEAAKLCEMSMTSAELFRSVLEIAMDSETFEEFANKIKTHNAKAIRTWRMSRIVEAWSAIYDETPDEEITGGHMAWPYPDLPPCEEDEKEMLHNTMMGTIRRNQPSIFSEVW